MSALYAFPIETFLNYKNYRSKGQLKLKAGRKVHHTFLGQKNGKVRRRNLYCIKYGGGVSIKPGRLKTSQAAANASVSIFPTMLFHTTLVE